MIDAVFCEQMDGFYYDFSLIESVLDKSYVVGHVMVLY